MTDLMTLLQREGNVAEVLGRLSGLAAYPDSMVGDQESLFFLGRGTRGRHLGLLMGSRPEPCFELDIHPVGAGGTELLLGLGQTNHTNAQALRARLPFAAPTRVGVCKSAGLGDRLGIATPGHIRALRKVKGVFPILAQQSIREMERTGRTPEEVMDAATWGVFQEGWRGGFGADADHLKTAADIDLCAAAGFVTYTLDPREHVDVGAETDSPVILEAKLMALPWERLASNPLTMRKAYLGKAIPAPEMGDATAECFPQKVDEERLLRAACKYGHALAHLAAMYQHLARVMAGRSFEVEISVDETDVPTTPVEHYYIASELKRLGVEWISLAPRYVGRFEKGVDYIGNLARFEADFRTHVAIAKALGPYKLSLHSGSDKFSIYPLVSRIAGELVHLKTAGTSYLEALRAVARLDPMLFRDILRFAVAHYEQDRASYYVSAKVANVPGPDWVSDSALGELLDHFDVRQVLHVTFGTVLTALDERGKPLFRGRLLAALEANEEVHYAALQAHIGRHLAPFSD